MHASPSHSDAQLIVALQRLAAVAAVLTALAGLTALLGWTFGIAVLKNMLPGQATMRPLTALGFLLASAALWLLRDRMVAGLPGRLAMIFAGAVAILGGLTLMEYLTGLDLGIDQLLFREAVRAEAIVPPGRPAPATTFCTLLLGLALLRLNARPAWLAPLCAVITLFVAGLALLGYAYEVTSLYQIGPYVPIAPYTALALVLLALGVLAARPEGPIIGVLTTHLAGSAIGRRLLPAAILLPFALGWLRLAGQHLGLYNTEFGTALFAAANIVVFTGLVYWSSRLLNQADSRRQAVHTELREREERLRSLADATPNGLITVTPAGVIEWSNRRAEALFGYGPGQLVGRPMDKLVPGWFQGDQHAQRVADPQARAMGAGRDLFGLRQDETEFPVEIGLSPLDSLEDKLTLASIIDITERKNAEAALRRSEERFATAFRASPAALTVTRLADGLFVDANDQYLHLLGYERDEVIGHTSTGLNMYPDPADRAELVRRLRAEGTVRNFEMALLTKAGERRSVLFSTEEIELGGETHILATLIDITERKRAEEALRLLNAELETRVEERTADLAALMDNIPDTIYFKDRASRFTRINLAQARLLGVATPQLAVGKTDADFQASQLAAEYYAEEQRLLDSGQPLLDRLESNPTPTGEPRWLSATKVPLKDASGQVVGLVGISRDITERIKAEDVLRRLNQQLADRVHELSLLNKLEEQLQSCVTIEGTYQLTAQFMSQLSPSQIGALYIVNADRTQVTTAASWGVPALEPRAFALDDCWALRRGQIHLLDHAHQGLPCPHLNDSLPPAFLCMPLLAHGEALGVLHLRATDENSARTFEESTQQLAHVVADSLALTWANLTLRETLRQQAIRDPLTGLFNRRFMEESLVRELQRAARNRQSVSLIMMDVDHFKQVNDRFGHETGDAALRALGRLLQASSRASDIPCRYGGEEFLLILPEASLDIARQRAEQLRDSFRQMKFGLDSDPFGPVTLSLGVAAYPQHGEVFEAVLGAADAALYRAKTEGGDRTSAAPG